MGKYCTVVHNYYTCKLQPDLILYIVYVLLAKLLLISLFICVFYVLWWNKDNARAYNVRKMTMNMMLCVAEAGSQSDRYWEVDASEDVSLTGLSLGWFWRPVIACVVVLAVAVWPSDNIVDDHISEVTAVRVRLVHVLKRVTVHRYIILVFNQATQANSA